MNDRCKAETKAGAPCKAVAIRDGFCSLHAEPGRAAELGRRSGQARRYVLPTDEPLQQLQLPQTAQEVRDVVGQAICDVRARRLDPKVASTLGYLASVLLKSIETSNVEQRLAALEAVLKNGAAKK